MNDVQATPLEEIRGLIGALPPWPEAAEADIADADGSLGLLDGLAAWAAAGQGHGRLRLDRPRAALFLGSWGAGDAGAAQAALDAVRAGRSRLNALSRHNDAELRVYEMAVDGGAGEALGPHECATAMAYGMTAVEDGLDLLCLAAAGPGRAQAAANLSRALFDEKDEPMAALARHGGHALAALAGAVAAARMARVPVILDGFAALAAAAVLYRLDAGALDHCALAQPLDGPAPRRLQDALGKEAVLDLAVPAEDGSAALLVLGLLRAALAGTEAD